jgi:hypothetical protein
MKTQLLLALALTVVGCAAPTSDSEETSEDLVTGAGVTFSARGDAALKINLKVADGIQPKTKNKRFIRATVTRDKQSFGMWCTVGGQVGVSSKIDCSDYAATVSNDDDESFSMTFVKKGADYALSVDYSGDGTFYGDRVELLGARELDLDVSRGAKSSADPFVMASDLDSRLAALIGVTVPNHETRPLPVQSISFDLTNEMDLSLTLSLSKTGRVTASPAKNVSVLKTPGDLSSGLASATALKSRILAAM